VLEHVAHDVDLLAFEDLAQLLLVDPGPRGAHGGHAGDQRVQVRGGLGAQAGAVLQQRPAQALEGLVCALLDAPHLVHRRVDMPDDVELVERDAHQREWVTPIAAGAFLLSAVTGVLIFFHVDSGLNKVVHEWLGWVLLGGVALHVIANFSGFRRHLGARRDRF
jgi:hypothetical protein